MTDGTISKNTVTPDGVPLNDAYNAFMDGTAFLYSEKEELSKREREAKILADFALHPGFKIYIKRMVARRRRQRDLLERSTVDAFEKERALSFALGEELNVLKSMGELARKLILTEEEKDAG